MSDRAPGQPADVNGREPRHAPLAMDAAAFRTAAHQLVDQIAAFLESIPQRPVTRDQAPSAVRDACGLGTPLPEHASDPARLLDETARMLFDHSLFNGHPRFFGYITGAPAPIGMLGDLLASAVNPNVGARTLSPVATEIEAQTIRWIAEFIGYPTECGGLLTSGGNMANLVCFMAARAARADWDVRAPGHGRSRVASASRLRIDRDAHVAAEGGRPRWTGHRRHSVGADRRAPADGCGGAAAADRD